MLELINENGSKATNLNLEHNLTKSPTRVFSYLLAPLVVALCTLLCMGLSPYVEANNLVMVYLIGVVFIAMWEYKTRIPSILTVLLSAIAFDFFFIPPRLNLAIASSSEIITIIIMYAVAEILRQLTIHLRKYTEAAQKAHVQAETERIRNTLLLAISHDLRTPLTSIMGSASSFLHANEKLTPDMQRELIQNIYDESERLTRLIQKVLQLIRIETSTIKISKQLYLFEEVVGTALNKLEKNLEQRKLIVSLAQPTPLIPLDHILIEQVLINLIENAIKFTPPYSTIEITSELKLKHIIVKISDQGCGIDPAEINKIFTRFYKGRNPETNGIGLGLAFCKEIIKAHGGKIWAENKKSGGARFCFSIPYRLNDE